MIKLENVETVRERERERELQFKKIAFVCVQEKNRMDYQVRDGPSFL